MAKSSPTRLLFVSRRTEIREAGNLAVTLGNERVHVRPRLLDCTTQPVGTRLIREGGEPLSREDVSVRSLPGADPYPRDLDRVLERGRSDEG